MLTDQEISTICMTRLRSVNTFTQELQQNRQDALEAYKSKPYGNEIDGQSQFVTSDVRDTIEWILPSLIEMFVGDDNPVTFRPKDSDDVEAARVETNYVRDVFHNQNDGFLLLYSWLKDGLLQKNGIVKSYWDERVNEVQETYRSQSLEEYLAIMADDDVEVQAVSLTVGDDEFALSDLEEFGGIEGFLAMYPQTTFDIDAVRKENASQVRIKNVAPENFSTSRDNPSVNLDDSQWSCHHEAVLASDLIVDGYDKDLIDSIPSGTFEDYSEEKIERHEDEGSVNPESFVDRGSREIMVYEFYTWIDADEDGKDEFRMIKLAGPAGNVVLENEVVDPGMFSAWTPVINTHKFYGMSIYDLIGELQKLKSAVMRGMLDNIYLTNNPIKTVNPELAYMEDILESGPGVNWRVRSQDAISTHITPFMGEASLGVIGLIDKMREERTGVSGTTQGLNPDALADSTNLVGTQIMSQALQRVKMIARIFAETGLKHLMCRIHELCMKYDDKDRLLEDGTDYVTVSPREWKKRQNFSIKVGVGHADKKERIAGINTVLANHERIVAAGGLGGPLLTIENVNEALVEQAKLLGYPDATKFYRDPATYRPPPQEDPVDDLVQVETAKIAADVHKETARIKRDMKKHDDDMAYKAAKLQQDDRQFEAEQTQKRRLTREEFTLKYGEKLNANTGSA